MYKVPKNLEEYSYKNIKKLGEKRVLVRSCLNVTTDPDGNMLDSTRFVESLPLIKELAGRCKRLVIMGHLGRPTAKTLEFSFKNNVFKSLMAEMKFLGFEVELVKEISDLEKLHKNDDKKVYLLDNIRFFDGEETNDKAKKTSFTKQLAGIADVFINDAFPDYREAVSTYDIAKHLPSFIGPTFQKEVEFLSKFGEPERPFIAILGGAKLSEKLDVLKSVCELADKVIVGGAMAYTLLAAEGVTVGDSLIEVDRIDLAKDLLKKFKKKLVLPLDHMVARDFDQYAGTEFTSDVNIPEGMVAIDIGPLTMDLFEAEIKKAKCILWNGPMGVFEWDHSGIGTKQIGEEIMENKEAFKLAGGGDSIAAIHKYDFNGFNHISTGGGAMLSFMAYEKFPTLDVIVKK